MKSILFVIESLHRGGAERALSNITTHFPDDWTIDILINDKSLIGYPYKGSILSLARPDKKSAFYFVSTIIKRTFYLKKIKRENGYEVCISFLDSANISNVLSGGKYCRTIVSIRSDIMETKSGLCAKLVYLPLTRWLFRYADKIVAVSDEIGRKLICKLKLPETKVRVITNGYDRERIRERMQAVPRDNEDGSKMISGKKKIIVTVGRLVDQKGQWHLIRAFREVLKKEPQTILFILGEGYLKRYLEGLICIYGLQDKVILAGQRDNPFWYLANADIFILCSLYEGYPNALAEAVCCGVPCITTDMHSGAREILAPDLDTVGERVHDISEREYGILIPVCSGRKYKGFEPLETEEKKMAEAIAMLLGDGVKREHYRHKSRERSLDLGIDEKVREWVEVILEKDG